jgi:hypothetical protein
LSVNCFSGDSMMACSHSNAKISQSNVGGATAEGNHLADERCVGEGRSDVRVAVELAVPLQFCQVKSNVNIRLLLQCLRLVMSERRLVAKVVALPCCTSNPALSSRYGNPLVEAAQANEKEPIRFREKRRLFGGKKRKDEMSRMKRLGG